MAGDTEREGGCPCQARGALNSGMLTVGYQWMSGRVRCLGRKFRGRILDYINATPFAGQRVLVVGMEIQGRKSLSTVSVARRRRYQYAAGFISSRAIFGLPRSCGKRLGEQPYEVPHKMLAYFKVPLMGASRGAGCPRPTDVHSLP